METLEAIEKRRSCRKYQNKDLEKEIFSVVLNAGRLAPSAGNLQDRCFIIVKNKNTRQRIAELCGGQMWMQFAPVHIVVVSELKKNKQYYGIRGERVYSIQDCAVAVQNMLLAATDLGLGCCVVSAFDEDRLKDLLVIEDPARPQAVVTLGYCAEENTKPTPKHDLEKLVWTEKYFGRIENMSITLGAWSEIWEKKIKEVKENLDLPQKKQVFLEKSKEVGKKIKERLKNLRKPKSE
ncbi:nitroreductase family protein [Nanoarchaeota archaeon]